MSFSRFVDVNKLFLIADQDKDDVVGVEDARHFFAGAGITGQALGMIWQVAVVEKGLAVLTRENFAQALLLVSVAQGCPGEPLTQERAAAAAAAAGLLVPPPRFAEVTDAEWERYDAMFRAHCDPVTGLVSGGTAAGLFSRFPIGRQTLSRIWDLADMDKDGSLTCSEFAVSMALIAQAVSGGPTALPEVVPSTLLGSILDHATDIGHQPPPMNSLNTLSPSNSMITTKQTNVFDMPNTFNQSNTPNSSNIFNSANLFDSINTPNSMITAKQTNVFDMPNTFDTPNTFNQQNTSNSSDIFNSTNLFDSINTPMPPMKPAPVTRTKSQTQTPMADLVSFTGQQEVPGPMTTATIPLKHQKQQQKQQQQQPTHTLDLLLFDSLPSSDDNNNSSTKNNNDNNGEMERNLRAAQELQGEVKAVRARIATKRARLAQLQAQNRAGEGRCAGVSAGLAEVRDDRAAQEGKAAKLERSAEEARARVAEMEEEAATLREALRALERRREELSLELAERARGLAAAGTRRASCVKILNEERGKLAATAGGGLDSDDGASGAPLQYQNVFPSDRIFGPGYVSRSNNSIDPFDFSDVVVSLTTTTTTTTINTDDYDDDDKTEGNTNDMWCYEPLKI